jgi:transcriptional regulator with XRE-family HTH domain
VKTTHSLVGRLALAIPEQRRELGLSLSEVARLARVSRSTVTKLERGGRIDPVLVIQLGLVLTVLEVYRPAAPDEFPALAEVNELLDRAAARNRDLIGGAA